MPADDDVPYRRVDDFLMVFMGNASQTSRTMVTGAQQGRRGPRKGKPYAEISGNELARLATDNMRAAGRLAFSTAGKLQEWPVRRFVGQAIDLIHSGLRRKPLLKALRTHETGTDYGLPSEEVREHWGAFQDLLQTGLRQPAADPRHLAALCEFQTRYIIHPYGDGSGRLSTLLAAWVMLSRGKKIPNYNFCVRDQLHQALRLGSDGFARYYVGTFFPSWGGGGPTTTGGVAPPGAMQAM